MELSKRVRMLMVAGMLAVSVAGLPAVHAHADTKSGSGSGSGGGASCYNETTKRSTPNGQVEYVPLGDGVHSMAEGCDNGTWVMLGVVGALEQPSPTPVRPIAPLPIGAALGS